MFKNVTVLKDIPVDTFFDAMGMFANAMGNDCTFCHSPKASLDRAKFADADAEDAARARQMIAMMNTINKNFFKGEPRVTCFTCHHGNQSPRSDPNLALQYSHAGGGSERRATSRPTRRSSPTTILDKYMQAVGGADRLARLTSFTAKGTYAGFDTLFEEGAGRDLREGAEPVPADRPHVDGQQHADVQRHQPAGWRGPTRRCRS